MKKRSMSKCITSKGEKLPLLAEFPVNSHFQLGVYQGTISEFDIIIKYKQLLEGEWSYQRTPKHIHWTVDILIKQNEEPEATDRFLSFLLDYWESVTPIKDEKERIDILSTQKLLDDVNKEAMAYPELAEKGEYSVKFLILLAKLLMIQEKTNKNDAYMFENLLKQLKEHEDIFKIVSTATHR